MTATNGHKACALPAAPRQRPEAPPTTTTRSAPRAARGFFAAAKPYRAAVRPRQYEHANVRPTHRSHAATIAVRPTTTSSAPFRDLNAIAAIPPLTRVAHHKPRASGPPPTPCALLHRRLPRLCVLGSCISHGSAGLEPTAEDKLLKAPVAPGYSFAFSTPRSQWQAGTMPPHLPN